MPITRYAFRGEADVPRIVDLVCAMPLSCRHVIDLPWRLSAPVINEGRDAALWEDADGQVVGFAAWQLYWAALDFFIMPGPEAQAVESDLFAWADGQFRQRDAERGRPLPYAVEFRDDDEERRRVVEAHGFLMNERDCYVSLQHALVDVTPMPALPDGFTLCPLKGEQEAVAYSELHRAAFESASMTPEWRARTIRMPQYRPDLDLVIGAPDGSLAGFCVGWLDPSRRVAQVEPIGVHPRFSSLGWRVSCCWRCSAVSRSMEPALPSSRLTLSARRRAVPINRLAFSRCIPFAVRRSGQGNEKSEGE